MAHCRRLALIAAVLVTHARLAVASPPVFEDPVPLANVPGEVGWSHSHSAMATDDAGTWVVAWESDDSLGGTIGHEGDVLYARSTDHGLSFSPVAALNSGAAADGGGISFGGHTYGGGGRDLSPSLATDGSGTWMAVWTHDLILDQHVMLARSTDNGATWGPEATLFDDGVSPRIATDGAGTWIVVWNYDSFIGIDSELYVTQSTDGGATWTTPHLLNSDAATDGREESSPAIRHGATAWIAAWTRGVYPSSSYAPHVHFARSLDGGATWSAPTLFDPVEPTVEESDFAPSLATDGAGHWVAVWGRRSTVAPTPPEPADTIMMSRSTDDGATWTPPIVLNDGSDPAGDARSLNPTVTAGGGGTFLVAWPRGSGNGDCPTVVAEDVQMTFSEDDGTTWSAPAPLHADPPSANPTDLYVDLGRDVAGHWVAVWSRNTANGGCGAGFYITTALAGHPCGNGALDAGEVCDDGTRSVADCCGRTCQLDPLGTPCTRDADLCTFDRCDGNGACEHVLEPDPSCFEPLAPKTSPLKVRPGADPSQSKLQWKWRGQQLEYYQLGNPTFSATDYALCVYHGSPGLLTRADAPGLGSCGPKQTPCWQWRKDGYRYTDKDGTPSGMFSVSLKRGEAGKASIQVKGGGANLALAPFPVPTLPVTVQLMSSLGYCWQTRYDAGDVRRNDAKGVSALNR